jgi:hypothetical protein
VVSVSFTLRGQREHSDQKIAVRRTIDRGPGGAWRFLDERSFTDPDLAPKGYDDRREVIFDGQKLAIRRGWGPWMDRDNMDALAERLLTSAYDAAPTLLDALGPYLVIGTPGAGGGAAGLEPNPTGLPVVFTVLSMRTPNLEGPTEPRDPQRLRELRDTRGHWGRWFAATHVPTELQGQLGRTAEGDVVAGSLEVEGRARVEGVERAFVLHLQVTTLSLPEQVSFQLPEERLPATRDRPWKAIEDVMGDDLAEIYRRRAQ